ncbi:hypothetical protein V492_03225 [Pseudogymnoascus sp. VKM F-4246]|nr:hypothetical protein V492_03225 [Pseudogymnoascus sp. VKM F-4246]
MAGYGIRIYENEDGFKYFVCDDDFNRRMLPEFVVDGDFDTFNFFTQKPELPYTIGSCLKAHPHTPQPPDNEDFPGCEPKCGDETEKHTVRPFDCCLLHPPWPGKTGAGVVEFKVVDWVRAGDPNTSQVVAIRVLNSTVGLPTDRDIIAKIYDPLYFNHIHTFADIFRFADYCYRRESAAYSHLVDLQGSVIPRYYGSYTISLPGNGKVSRDVRLILKGIVPGPSMSELDPSSFKQAERKEIMKAVVDSERAMYAHKVVNRDIHPRNILLPPKQPHHRRRAVIVDFGISIINPDMSDKTYLTGLANPPKSFHCLDPSNHFWEWVDWDWDAWINKTYRRIKGSRITPKEEYLIRDFMDERIRC